MRRERRPRASSGLTFGACTLARLPSASITKVERSMPMYFLPPWSSRPTRRTLSATACSSSARSVNGSWYFSRNFACDASRPGSRRGRRRLVPRIPPDVPDPAGLGGASRRVVLGIEVEDDGRASEGGQGDRLARVRREREVGRRPTFLDHASVRRITGIVQDGSHPSPYPDRSSGPQRAYASSGLEVSSSTLASYFAATSFTA